MQSLIDASVDETPSSGAKNIQVEIGQLDHEAMFLKMPVSETAASQKNVRGANMRDDSATRVIKELGADGNNFDREKAKHIQVEIGQLDHEAMFLKMPVSQTAGSRKNVRGANLRDVSATRVIKELGADGNNFDPEKARNAIPVFFDVDSLEEFYFGTTENHYSEKAENSNKPNENDVMVQNMQDLEEDRGLGRRKSSFRKATVVTQTAELGDYCGTILIDNSATLFIEEMGAEDVNFDREKARNAIPVFFDDGLKDSYFGSMDFGRGLGRRKSSFREAIVENYDRDPNGNDIEVQNIKQLEDEVHEPRRRKRSVRNMFRISRAAGDLKKHCLKSPKKDPLVAGSSGLENPNPRKKKSSCAMM